MHADPAHGSDESQNRYRHIGSGDEVVEHTQETGRVRVDGVLRNKNLMAGYDVVMEAGRKSVLAQSQQRNVQDEPLSCTGWFV